MIKQPQKTARGKRDITGLNRIMQNKRAVALSLVWQPFVTPGCKGICSGMRCVRLRSDFHTLIKPEDASFHVVQRSQHLRVLLKLKIILLVRIQRIPEHIPLRPGCL